jgi:hypothetical protein
VSRELLDALHAALQSSAPRTPSADVELPELGLVLQNVVARGALREGTASFLVEKQTLPSKVRAVHAKVRAGEQELELMALHTRLAFLARNVPPAILMQPVDVNFDPASGVRTSPVAVPVFIHDLIVSAILQRGLGATYDTLPAHILSWCRTIVELPHHEGGLGITPLPASGMAAFYSATANLVSWLGSLPHASPNGLPARLLTTPPLGPARHFRHSNSCTTTC